MFLTRAWTLALGLWVGAVCSASEVHSFPKNSRPHVYELLQQYLTQGQGPAESPREALAQVPRHSLEIQDLVWREAYKVLRDPLRKQDVIRRALDLLELDIDPVANDRLASPELLASVTELSDRLLYRFYHPCHLRRVLIETISRFQLWTPQHLETIVRILTTTQGYEDLADVVENLVPILSPKDLQFLHEGLKGVYPFQRRQLVLMSRIHPLESHEILALFEMAANDYAALAWQLRSRSGKISSPVSLDPNLWEGWFRQENLFFAKLLREHVAAVHLGDPVVSNGFMQAEIAIELRSRGDLTALRQQFFDHVFLPGFDWLQPQTWPALRGVAVPPPVGFSALPSHSIIRPLVRQTPDVLKSADVIAYDFQARRRCELQLTKETQVRETDSQ